MRWVELVSIGLVSSTSTTHCSSRHPFDNYLKKLSSVLGGHALVGPLFGAPLLLVEGDDDHRIWSHVPRQPEHKEIFAVLPCDGDEI